MKHVKMLIKILLLKVYYFIQEKFRTKRGVWLPYLEDIGQVLRADGKHHNWNLGYTQYYSQCGQDLFVDFLLNGKTDGVYLDVGGNDPIVINNTYYFEKKGWSGLAFEPLKKYIPKWKEQRKVRCLQIALGDKADIIRFSEAKKDYLSRRSSGNGGVGVTGDCDEAEIVDTYEVSQRRLCDVLEEYGMHDIDYLSLDVEGMEYEILSGINWDVDNIKILSVENVDSLSSELKIRQFLVDKGYIYLARLSSDDFFIKKDYFEIAWR
ncbi:FkbM family methyltransferase [Schwartzia succinivorans]|jgi:FkbM family methyltransferase|uniref:Methyltransferase, FkbM family n=1 Tax=Schwartzia succinivorans DSM 10502 TaxID=1123243 RepID=A0A1M4XQQ2_9FIRM|nr:FkbM family methyltransferase [Schwartzia succinivorans]SHE95778.1 methyltransferase, FkbM family [Schwartzia succinivorans DSM 10502]